MTKITVNNYELDEEQTKPIIENPKYSIIIAGAGSGKTLTLIGKVKYLIEKKLYKPEEICCISFTNEATNNLKKQLFENCNVEIPTFTFHKLALNILKQDKIDYSIANSNLLSYIIDEFFYSKCFGNIYLQNCVYDLFEYFFKNENNWNKILNSKEYIQKKKLIMTFINLFKGNNKKIEEFLSIIKNEKKKFIIIIYTIYLIYETEKNSTYSLDFDDMISVATEKVKNPRLTIPFKMIIIDEFQDTSHNRFQLIKEIMNKNNASLCVVGDDYQSIYHFSGCDLQLFLEFQNYFPNTRVYKLEKTYRNSQELISVSGNFIQKNKAQIKKNLVSDKHLEKPIHLIYYQNEYNVLDKIIKDIPKDKRILILGRNNFDLKKYIKDSYELNENHQIITKKYKDYSLFYLTVHASKGLESDVVILLNMAKDIYGFPSLKQEDKILNYVKYSLPYPYEEERRLFYVALTRTKSDIYLLIPMNNPSSFIKEIKKERYVQIKKL